MIAPQMKVDVASHLALRKQLTLLTMGSGTRRKVLRKCAFEVRKASRKNIREQKDYLGRRFEARKKGRGRMLRGLSRTMSAYATTDEGVVTWRNPISGKIAKAHQEGISNQFDVTKITKRQGKKELDDPATIDQARALKREGYRRRENGRRIAASIKWIRENLSVGQAGFILRTMRGAGKTKWAIPLPERAFLGVDETELSKIINGVFDTITSEAGIA